MANKLIKVPNTQNLYSREVITEYKGNYGMRKKNETLYTIRYRDENNKRKQVEQKSGLSLKAVLKIQENILKKVEALKAKPKKNL